MLTGHIWVATQYRLTGFSEGQNVATEYRWAGRQQHGPLRGGSGTVINYFVSASPQAMS